MSLRIVKPRCIVKCNDYADDSVKSTDEDPPKSEIWPTGSSCLQLKARRF